MSGAENVFSRVAARAARRPALTLALAAALGLVGVVAALGLRPTAASDTLVGHSSSSYRATQSFYSRFGQEPILVLVKGDLRKLLLSADIDRLVGLEGCLSGNLPRSAFAAEGGAQGPCAQLTRSKTVKVVLGPGTFINEAALQIDNLLSARRKAAETQAREARGAVYRAAIARGIGSAQAGALGAEAFKATLSGFAAEVSALAIRYGLSAPPNLDDHRFVSMLVFDGTKRSGTPKQRFAYLFPSRDAALISVRLKAGLSQAQRTATIATVRRAVNMPQWRLANGESYLVTGEPVIASDLESSIAHSIELLLAIVVVAMGVILTLVLQTRPRLLPLAIALLAGALTFGALRASGAQLTMASVAVLPVLVGLAVDYAIQFQSRFSETLSHAGDPSLAIRDAAARGGPAIATAACASIAGLLMLALSPVPMVRGFGVVLVAGVALAFLCALVAGAAAIALVHSGGMRTAVTVAGSASKGRLAPVNSRLGGLGTRLAAPLGSAWLGARELLFENPVNRLLTRGALDGAVARPARVLGLGLALAALGWGLDTQAQVQTDVAKLAPQRMSSLANLRTLERASGVGGEIDLMLSGPSLTKPASIEWMNAYQASVLRRFGYGSSHGCGQAQVCPAFSLPDLFADREGTHGKLTQGDVSELLKAIPPYFSQSVISPDRRVATLAFGIRLMGLDQQHTVIEQMRAELHPPAGVNAQLVGLSVLAAQSAAQLASPWRRVVTLLAALAAVALVLLVAFRGNLRRALVPLAPIVLATGWSALVLFTIRVPLNPMSVTLGALVIAVSTEFAVLLSERQRQEALDGHGTVEALRRAYRHTGAAVAASGITAIAGFGVLAFSDIAMVRDFGLATLVDLSVSLVGVWVTLPAVVVLAERKERLWARASGATSPSLG